jgi:hypothetical protein
LTLSEFFVNSSYHDYLKPASVPFDRIGLDEIPVDLRAEILKEHSKRQALKIAAWVGSDKTRFRELMELFLHGEYRVTQRAAWIVGHCGQQHPALIIPWLPAMLKRMMEPDVHIAVKRNVLRIIMEIEIPRTLLGRIMSICFAELNSPTSPIAVKVFSMYILERVARQEPGISRELRETIEQMLPYAGAAIRACGRKVLKRLSNRKIVPQNAR